MTQSQVEIKWWEAQLHRDIQTDTSYHSSNQMSHTFHSLTFFLCFLLLWCSDQACSCTKSGMMGFQWLKWEEGWQRQSSLRTGAWPQHDLCLYDFLSAARQHCIAATMVLLACCRGIGWKNLCKRGRKFSNSLSVCLESDAFLATVSTGQDVICRHTNGMRWITDKSHFFGSVTSL